MKAQNVSIGHIPAVLWGENTGLLIIAVHGDMASKTDSTIQLLAEIVTSRGYQVLSFDLPEHGDRKESPELCKVEICVSELKMVLDYAKEISSDISLFACSLGAYFSMMAYPNEVFRQALFLSPVVDMFRLLQNMMGWFNITEAQLEAEKEVSTSIGKTLYWDYYCYAKANLVKKWQTPTSVLYGEKDETSDRDRVEDFCKRFGANLTVMSSGEHWFHTNEQMAFYKQWLGNQINERK